MKEFKNFLPQSLSDELHDIMTGDHFPWYWIDDVTTAPEDRTAVPEYYTNILTLRNLLITHKIHY